MLTFLTLPPIWSKTGGGHMSGPFLPIFCWQPLWALVPKFLENWLPMAGSVCLRLNHTQWSVGGLWRSYCPSKCWKFMAKLLSVCSKHRCSLRVLPSMWTLHSVYVFVICDLVSLQLRWNPMIVQKFCLWEWPQLPFLGVRHSLWSFPVC